MRPRLAAWQAHVRICGQCRRALVAMALGLALGPTVQEADRSGYCAEGLRLRLASIDEENAVTG